MSRLRAGARTGLGRLRREEGQSIILVALGMIALIAIVGVVIDVGRLYVAQRELQTAADAAALAGVEALPDGATAQTAALTYSATSAGGGGGQGLNDVSGLSGDDVTTSTELECLSQASAGSSCLQGSAGSGCDVALPPAGGVGCNAVKVTEKATVPLTLLNVLGLSSWGVSASSTATLGGISQPLDIEVVIDTTASMGSPCSSAVPGIPSTSSTPTKLDCADYGVRSLLAALDPCPSSEPSCGADVAGNDVANPLDRVGLMIFGGLNTAKGFAAGSTGVPQELGCTKNISTADLTYGSTALYQVVPFSSD
jgi:Flp pilus assembly protein TadG